MDRDRSLPGSLSRLDSQLPDLYRGKFEDVLQLAGFQLEQNQTNEDQTQSRFLKLFNTICSSGLTSQLAVALTCQVLKGLGWEGEELETLGRHADVDFSLEAFYPEIQSHISRMNCKKIGKAVNNAVVVLDDQLDQFYVSIFRLALYGIHTVSRLRVEERSTFVGYFQVLYENLVRPSEAAAFTCCVLTRFGKDVTDLQKYATPNYNLEQKYPEVDLRLTVTELFNNVERKDDVIRIIARQDRNNYATDKITFIADFVQLLCEREVIKVNGNNKLQELAKLCRRPTFFNDYYIRQNLPTGKRRNICAFLYIL